MLFIVLLAMSGLFSGIVSDVVYYLAFIIPLFAYFLLLEKRKIEDARISVAPNKEAFALSLYLAAPTVAGVFFIAMLSSLLLSLLELPTEAARVESITAPIILSALLPAFFEELLFRFVPLSLFKNKPRRDAIFFSALFFALAHCDLAKMPYAFFAGVVFATLDILADSIWPSVLLHLFNNAVSLLWMRYGTDIPIAFIAVLLALTVLSLILAAILKRSLFDRVIGILKEKRTQRLTAEAWLFLTIVILITLTEALWK